MSLRCAMALHKWQPVMRLRPSKYPVAKYFNTPDIRVALWWMAVNYMITPEHAAAEIDWRFIQVCFRCKRCGKRKRP